MVICNQAVTEFEDRLQNSLTQFTEIKILYSFYLNNKNEGTKRNMYRSTTATEITRTGFSRKMIFGSIDRSWRPRGGPAQAIIFWDYYAS